MLLRRQSNVQQSMVVCKLSMHIFFRFDMSTATSKTKVAIDRPFACNEHYETRLFCFSSLVCSSLTVCNGLLICICMQLSGGIPLWEDLTFLRVCQWCYILSWKYHLIVKFEAIGILLCLKCKGNSAIKIVLAKSEPAGISHHSYSQTIWCNKNGLVQGSCIS